ncbi:MAG: ammonium transporter [Nitrososphaeraceae archaeon]
MLHGTIKYLSDINTGDTSWLLVSTGLVMIMTPALGFFEAGLLRSKNSLSVIMQCFSGLAILSILWIVIGFSLSFSVNNGIIGGLDWIFLNSVPLDTPLFYAPNIPGISYASFQMMFAVITPLLITGAFADRMRFRSYLVFIILWSIFIYYPVAHWVWGKGGWLGSLGVFDFAGGIVVHVNAGMAALAAALIIGKRRNFGPEILRPHNIPLAAIGASLLWMGWFGFNAGSALTAGGLAANTLLVTQTASAASSLVWILLSWKRSGKPSAVAAINGAIAGLAGVTPASGYISVQNSLILGIVLGLVSYYAIMLLKERLRIDDALDVSSVHGVTGIVGTLAVGLIASSLINPAGPNGLIYGNPIQLGLQALGVVSTAAFSFGGTIIIIKLLDKTIGLRVREEQEEVGLDLSEHAEKAYL